MPLFELSKARRKRLAYEAGFRDDWTPFIEQRVPGWHLLSPVRRQHVLELALELVIETTWEGTPQLPITDEVKVTIAGQAALALCALPVATDVFDHIIVRSGEWEVQEEAHDEPFVVSRDAQHILGEVLDRRSTLIVWDAVLEDLDDPDGAAGVVFHELAHKLDELDGVLNGTPPMTDERLLARWTDVCTEVFDAVDAGTGPDCIIDYAAENPSEFFAVVTEVFFCRPELLREEVPDLYEAFCEYYGQNTADRR